MTQRILIADSSNYFDQAMWQRVLPLPEFEIIGITNNVQALTNLITILRPDTILIDLSASEMGGLWTIETLRIIHPNASIIILMPGLSVQYTQAALFSGATACLAKSDLAETLPETLRTLPHRSTMLEAVY